MARKAPIELFMPPNMLKAKVGGGVGGPDLAAIKRAEAAMEGLKNEFSDWIADDVTMLMAARTRYAEMPGADARSALLRAAHDIKGQAPTFNFPMIARVAASLAHMIAELPAQAKLPLHLVDAHVNAVLVMHKQGLRDTKDKIAQALCTELDARVIEVLAGSKKS